MNKEFEYIDIVFENCNVVRIPSELVWYLRLVGIEHTIYINAVGQFIEIDDCKEFEVKLQNEALDIKTNMEREIEDEDCESFKNHLTTYKDITHIFVKVDENKEFYISVPWESTNRNDVSNKLQKTEFDTESFTIGSKYDSVPETTES